MKAIFPDAKSLQPIPYPDVHPNVSHNADSGVKNSEVNIPATPTTLNSISTIPTGEISNQKNSYVYVFGCLVIFIILFLIIFIHRRKAGK